jgi:hypothetical protein
MHVIVIGATVHLLIEHILLQVVRKLVVADSLQTSYDPAQGTNPVHSLCVWRMPDVS